MSISKIEGSLLCSDGLMLGVKSEHILFIEVKRMTEKRFVYMNLLETEAISVSDDECYYFNEYGTVKKICEMLNALHEENKQLKAQLYCDDEEGVCNICKHHYLEKGETYEKYYISKCKKGHEKCSKTDLKYCDDFELKEGDV